MHITLLTLLIVCSWTSTCGLLVCNRDNNSTTLHGYKYEIKVISMKNTLVDIVKCSLDLSYSYKVGFTCCSDQENAPLWPPAVEHN